MSLWLRGISGDIAITEETQDSGNVDMLIAQTSSEVEGCNEGPESTVRQDDIDSADSSSIGETLPQLPEYENFIAKSEAYSWLLSRMSQHDGFLNGKVDAMITIENQILGHFRTQEHLTAISRSRPQALTSLKIHLRWDPREYITSLGLDPDSCDFDTILCVTGTPRESQAIGVVDYLRQTWPTTTDVDLLPMLRQLITIQKKKVLFVSANGQPPRAN
jgi:hypothetical protein